MVVLLTRCGDAPGRRFDHRSLERVVCAGEALNAPSWEWLRREIGPVAVMGDVNFVGTLPKTRSGKIMRRVFRAVILERDPGDITTIEDEGSVEEARRAWSAMREELAAQAPPPPA